MFKKPIEAKALQRLSGADKKKLRRTLKERFPNASDADVDEILPPKADITVAKYPNRVHVYSVEGGFPVLFDVDGRGTETYPTVFALWKVTELLPAFLLKGGEVSRFVIGGADLMFPGISIPPEGLPSFLAGEPWAVKVPGNSAPIAVGVTTMSSEGAIKAGLRGKALRITHYYRDSLWQSVEGHYVPNAGFLEDVVIEDPEFISQLSAALQEASIEIGENDTIEEGNPAHNVDGYTGVDYIDSVEKDAATEKGVEVEKVVVETSKEITAKTSDSTMTEVSKNEEHNSLSAEVSKNEEHTSLSTEEVDALLDNCLLQAFYTSVKDKDLPMPASTLWSNHILPCRPPGVTLDIKRSSHKKLSKWLQSKSSTGLISAKEDKYKKEVMLLGVNRGHADYIAFKPTKRVQENVDQKHDSSIGEGVQGKMQLEIAEVYKSSTHVNPIFSAVGADTGKYYSASEAAEIVFKYIEKENLVKPTDKAVVVLDAILCDALFKGTVKKGSTYPTEIHKKDLGSTFLNRMQVHHRVSKGNESALRKGAVKSIQIMAERRQGNKKVTRVSGIESFLLDADSLSSELQKKFACSTSVAELPGKKGQHEVLVQGGVIDDLARHIVDHYGVPKRYIEVLDKTRK